MALDRTESLRAAKRVVIILSRRSLYWNTAWESTEEVITVALKLVKLVGPDARDDPSAVRFLAKERWGLRRFIVFDVFHDTYDPAKAHCDGTYLPVISVWLSTKEMASVAGRLMANKVNHDIAAIHNLTGIGSEPPFAIDHEDGNVPYYPWPRNIQAPKP